MEALLVTSRPRLERLKDLEYSLFLGGAHFVVKDGMYFVETKVSRIVG